MTRLLVNDTPHPPHPGAKTWGDLLQALDDTSHQAGRVVTAARLDGVDEPSFRDAVVCARVLDELAVVEVETETPTVLLADTVREALAGLDCLGAFALDVGQRFRGVDLGAAHQGLLELVQGLQVLTSLLATMGAVLKTDVGSLVGDGPSVPALLDALGGHLEQLIEAQQSQDWLTVADIVEYDIEPALQACRPVFAHMGAAPASAH